MPPWRVLLRAAGRLQAAWQAHANQGVGDERPLLSRLGQLQRTLERAGRLLDKARTHGLTLALPGLRQNLLARVEAVRETADRVRQQLERPPAVAPALSTFLAEPQQVEDEFGDFEIDWKRRALTATTEPITLEGVALGRFSIQFFWNRLPSHTDIQCFDVVALDPNPASTDDRVTHPHVKGTRLCAGDATVPLAKALEQGRLADAFCLIRSVLTHYNPNSPHVRLDDWGGTDCHDCGCVIGDEDGGYCERCRQGYCADCTGSCTACDNTRCYGCLERCSVCEDHCCLGCLRPSGHSQRGCCPACLRACAACGSEVARDELTPETALCPTCGARQPPAGEPAPAPGVSTPTLNPLPPEDDHAATLEPAAAAAV